jgi:hypothetical protein
MMIYWCWAPSFGMDAGDRKEIKARDRQDAAERYAELEFHDEPFENLEVLVSEPMSLTNTLFCVEVEPVPHFRAVQKKTETWP